LNKQNETFPPGISNAYLFAMFNALSFQIVLGSPMVLYAKRLGASATILGVVVGMMPLLVIFQMPAAQYVARVGYKRFVYAGWGARVTFIFFMAMVPITSVFLNEANRLALMLILLFAFNLSRGISSAGWLPWISSIVPASIRGKYLARDAAAVNFASFGSFVLAGLCLGRDPRAWQFSALFLFSGIMGAISLRFLKRIPEGEMPAEVRTSNTPVPWMEMVRYAPFHKLVRTVVAWSLAYGGMTAFSVAFLKTSVQMPEGQILLVNSLSFLGGLSSLWIIGARLDALGSKPVLSFSFGIWILISLGWASMAGHLIAPTFGLIVALQLLMGLFAALVAMSNIRLAMAVIPVMGRNHFFAIYSVLSNLSLGLAPILWGIVIDGIGAAEMRWGGADWNRYTIFFAASAAVMVIALGLARRLVEPEAASMDMLLREVLLHSPQRILVRIWPRE
jgi:MFS family permease